jgi:predicted Rossmann fold flavoprotein
MQTDTLIIGAGPAGWLAAITAAGQGRSVTLFERMEKPGLKLLATGGGRCNLTHDLDVAGMMAAFGKPQDRFIRPAMHEFAPQAIRDFFEQLGVPTVVQEDGCVFPVSQNARDVLQALEAEARRLGVVVKCGCPVSGLIREDQTVTGVMTPEGPLHARCVIMAAGGRSYPELGSDGSGFKLAADIGHRITPPAPALVPLITAEDWPAKLTGIVLPRAHIRIDQKEFAKTGRTGPLLFTHRGISGPAVLDLSGDVAALLPQAGTVIVRVSVVADRGREEWLKAFNEWRGSSGTRYVASFLAEHMPRALADVLCAQANAWYLPVAKARREVLGTLADLCVDLPLSVTGTEGWTLAMATRGGVARDEVDPKTLASRKVKGLFFAGEVVDVDGPCGGYNLTWAFASGYLAGLRSKEKV